MWPGASVFSICKMARGPLNQRVRILRASEGAGIKPQALRSEHFHSWASVSEGSQYDTTEIYFRGCTAETSGTGRGLGNGLSWNSTKLICLCVSASEAGQPVPPSGSGLHSGFLPTFRTPVLPHSPLLPLHSCIPEQFSVALGSSAGHRESLPVEHSGK